MPEADTLEADIVHTTGTVAWFDAEEGIGAIRPDDGTPSCAVRSATLHDCGVASLTAGDRVRFRVREEGDERTATDLTLLSAVERWENEGGAVPAAPVTHTTPADDDHDG